MKDGETAVLWHQWYGSYRTRLVGAEPEAYEPGVSETIAVVERGEKAFVADYPNLDLSDLTPAWGPECNLVAEQRIAAEGNPLGERAFIKGTLRRVRRWPRYGLRGLTARGLASLGRWWRLP